jgi:hypothetical protein
MGIFIGFLQFSGTGIYPLFIQEQLYYITSTQTPSAASYGSEKPNNQTPMVG